MRFEVENCISVQYSSILVLHTSGTLGHPQGCECNGLYGVYLFLCIRIGGGPTELHHGVISPLTLGTTYSPFPTFRRRSILRHSCICQIFRFVSTVRQKQGRTSDNGRTTNYERFDPRVGTDESRLRGSMFRPPGPLQPRKCGKSWLSGILVGLL